MRPHALPARLRTRALPQTAPDAAAVSAAKQALLAAVAARPRPPRTALQPALDTLASAGRLLDGAYEGEWATLYTDSTGPSAGRVGPLQGEVRQSFNSADATYANTVAWPSLALPLLRARLTGTASRPRPGRINVVFENTQFFVAGVAAGERAFPAGSPGSRGHWTLLYEDDDVRVFETNKGSLFVLGRV
jgi:hypothetical protein